MKKRNMSRFYPPSVSMARSQTSALCGIEGVDGYRPPRIGSFMQRYKQQASEAAQHKDGWMKIIGVLLLVWVLWRIWRRQKRQRGQEARMVVEEVDADGLRQRMESGQRFVVMYSMDGCHHCREARPLFERAAKMASCPFVIMDSRHVGPMHSIRGYPTIRLHKSASEVVDYGNRPRTVDDFVNFSRE